MNYIQESFELQAKKVPDYQRNVRNSAQITAWANKYCELVDALASDTNNYELVEQRDSYIAALMLKFWDKIKYLYDSTRTIGTYEYDDFISVLYDRINYACKYRAWQKEGSKTNAQACINQAINTEVQNMFYAANLDKNKCNVACNTISLDTPFGDDEESGTLADTLGEEVDHSGHDTEFAIQSFINSNKVIEAIIFDVIAFNDCMKYTKETVNAIDSDGNPYKYTKNHSEFWPYRCVQILSKLPEDYGKYFARKYRIANEPLEACLAKIRSSNNQKLYKYLDAARNDLKSYLAG